MSDLRGTFAQLRTREAAAKASRVEANASAQASTLGELARQRFQEDEEAKRAEAAARQQAHEELREEYLRGVAERGLEQLPHLVADKWDLPEGHPFVTDLQWSLVTAPFAGAKFSEGPDGAIRVDAGAGPDAGRLEETFETRIEGRCIRATLMKPGGAVSGVQIRGHDGAASEGLGSLTDLGRFLSAAPTGGDSPRSAPDEGHNRQAPR